MLSGITQKIITPEKLPNKISELKRQGKTIAFCSGCFDVFHAGHVIFFNECKDFADIVIVSVGSDKVIRQLKGPNRPVNPEKNRMFIVASMKDVDYVVGDDGDILPGKINFYKLMEVIKPDFFILNEDDSAVKEKQELCKKMGAELKLVKRFWPDYLEPTSTTQIIKNIYKNVSD